MYITSGLYLSGFHGFSCHHNKLGQHNLVIFTWSSFVNGKNRHWNLLKVAHEVLNKLSAKWFPIEWITKRGNVLICSYDQTMHWICLVFRDVVVAWCRNSLVCRGGGFDRGRRDGGGGGRDGGRDGSRPGGGGGFRRDGGGRGTYDHFDGGLDRRAPRHQGGGLAHGNIASLLTFADSPHTVLKISRYWNSFLQRGLVQFYFHSN